MSSPATVGSLPAISAPNKGGAAAAIARNVADEAATRSVKAEIYRRRGVSLCKANPTSNGDSLHM